MPPTSHSLASNICGVALWPLSRHMDPSVYALRGQVLSLQLGLQWDEAALHPIAQFVESGLKGERTENGAHCLWSWFVPG